MNVEMVLLYTLKAMELIGTGVIQWRAAQAKVLQMQLQKRDPTDAEWKELDAAIDEIHRKIQNA